MNCLEGDTGWFQAYVLGPCIELAEISPKLAPEQLDNAQILNPDIAVNPRGKIVVKLKFVHSWYLHCCVQSALSISSNVVSMHF